MKRPWLLPVAVAAAWGACQISPIFAVSLGVIMVNDPQGHPIVRLFLDVGAGALFVTAALFLPEIAIAMAVLPMADLMNRFADSVQRHLCEEGEDHTCSELEWHPVMVPEPGLELSASLR